MALVGEPPRASPALAAYWHPVALGSYPYDVQPIVVVGSSRWPGPDKRTSQNLTADGQQGAFAVMVANRSEFSAGQFVLLDELSGAS
jgi:hypothetical protein